MSRPARPRIRSLKPECWQDERFAGVSRDARLLYDGLVSQADDEGRQSGHPALLKARIFPFDGDVTEEMLQAWLGELAGAALVELYVVAERRYISLPSWQDDQRIDRPTTSVFPTPPRFLAIDREESSSDREDSRSLSPSRAPADRTGTDQDQEQDQPAPEGAEVRAPDIRTVFDEWIAATERDASRCKLTPDRRRVIDKALRSHGLEDCLAAVRNIGASTDARSGYGRGQRYDDIAHALGDTKRIERWREPQTPAPGAVASSREDLAYLDDGVLPAGYDGEQTGREAA